ncbi:MAG TPA: hypothetical protein VFU05_12455 [Cyclobacteriaceae bacterium]|nr:hypothetical protein [Cyclobacteriaceae bacterium]
MRKYGSLFLLVMVAMIANAQQPFEEYGYKVKVGTLSKGKYVEFFDQDSLVEIGSVVLNTNSGKIVYFVTYDTTYSEATLQPEVISRWLSPDPLAGERYDYSPYNFVRNNPIIFTDPTGALDQYYGIVNGTLTYLGDDGQGDNIRLVAEGSEDQAADILDGIALSSMHGNGASTEDLNTLRSGDMSTVVTFNESNIQSEFQDASDRTISSGMENSVIITLEPSTATVDAQPGPTGINDKIKFSFSRFDGGEGNWTDGAHLAVGAGHGHPLTQDPTKVNIPGYSIDDSNSSKGFPSYSIDSYNSTVGGAATIHQASFAGKAGRSGTNPVGTTQSTNNIGRRSFLSVARGR